MSFEILTLYCQCSYFIRRKSIINYVSYYRLVNYIRLDYFEMSIIFFKCSHLQLAPLQWLPSDPELFERMLDSSPSLKIVNIWFSKFSRRRDHYSTFHCQQSWWADWVETVSITVQLYCRWLWNHYSFYLCHQNWERFIKTGSMYLQQGGQIFLLIIFAAPILHSAASCWAVFNSHQPICSIVWQRILDFSVVYFNKGLAKFILCSCKNVPIITYDCPIPLLAITLLSAMMKESVSIETITSIWTALCPRNVKNVLYLFISPRLSFKINGVKKSAPQ